MPSNFLYIDTNFPTFTGEETNKEQVDIMMNYLRIMVEQLRYTLNNLDMSNFNSKALEDFSADSTEDIVEAVTTLAAQLNQTNQSLVQLQHRVAALEQLPSRVSDAETNIATLQADMITVQQNITSLQTSDGTQNQKIAALETWEAGAITDLSSLRTDVNTALANITAIGNDVATLISEMAELKTAISVNSSGDAVFGKTGQRTDIKGDVYVNNLPYIGGGGV